MRRMTAGVRWSWIVAAGLGLALALAGILLAQQTMNAPRTNASLIKADPRFDTLIAPDAKLEILTDGYDWAEGPVSVPAVAAFCCGRMSPPTPFIAGRRAMRQGHI